MIKTLILTTTLLIALTQTSTAQEEKKMTIAKMEIQLATLSKEIADEKVKISQKEALLQDAKLALLKEKEAQKK